MSEVPPQNETLGSLFAGGKIRLVGLSVFNWGTFSGGHNCSIDEDGTLVTGETGAGKSTFVDAHQLLMHRPGKARFNAAAAGDSMKDRDLVSYLRGKIGEKEESGGRTKARYLRSTGTVSAIRGLYRNDLGEQTTLACLFWINGSGTSRDDVNIAYLLAMRDVPLAELINGLAGDDRSPSRGNLERAFPPGGNVELFAKWGTYEVRWRDALKMSNARAPALLARAMGLKKIDDLTLLVRDMVLDQSDAPDEAEKAVADFVNLESVYEQVKIATDRKMILAPLRSKAEAHQELMLDLYHRTQEQSVLETHFARERVRLADHRIQGINQRIDEIKLRLGSNSVSIDTKTEEHRVADGIFQDRGGREISRLNDQRRQAEAAGQRARFAAKRFDLRLREMGYARTDNAVVSLLDIQHGAMALGGYNVAPPTLDQLVEVRSISKSLLQSLDAGEADLQARWGEELGNQKVAKDNLVRLKDELKSLQGKPQSAMPSAYHLVRDKLCRDTGMVPSRLPFLAEMIDVKASEDEWRGAIERALGGLRFSFIIDEQVEDLVINWLNANPTGELISVTVLRSDARAHTDFREKSFLRKLEWKPGPLRDALKGMLAGHTLDCVKDADEGRRTPHSITKEGLIHHAKGRFVKDDRKPLNKGWCIGSSNLHVQAKLREEITTLEAEVAAIDARVDNASTAVSQTRKRREAADELAEIEFETIDVLGPDEEEKRLTRVIAEIESSSLDLIAAKADCQRIAGELTALREIKAGLDGDLREAGLAKQTVDDERTTQLARIRQEADAEALERVMGVYGRMQLEDKPEVIELAATKRAGGFVAAARTKANENAGGCASTFASYISKYEAIASSLPTYETREGLEVLGGRLVEWIAHLDELEIRQLAGLTERWREKLDGNSSQLLLHVQSSIRHQIDEINEGIENVNNVLKRTEFMRGTYLQLVPEPVSNIETAKLDEVLASAIRSSISGDRMEHYNKIKLAIDVIRRALEGTRRDTHSTRGMLDARYRFTFAARELDVVTHESINLLRGTGGKSGGEKESFSGSIAAAALAYVLTEPGANRPTYSSVFLDEAFSNTSDTVAKRVLKVFKQLGLTVSLITPFKNVDLARHFVKTAVVVSMNGAGESRLSPVRWEQIDGFAAKRDRTARAMATNLNVIIEDVDPSEDA